MTETVAIEIPTRAFEKLTRLANAAGLTPEQLVTNTVLLHVAAAADVPVNCFEAVDPSDEEDYVAEIARDARGNVIGEVVWRPGRDAQSLIEDLPNKSSRSVFPESSLAGARVQHELNKARHTR